MKTSLTPSILVLAGLLAAPLSGAEEFFARNWRVDDGLPNDMVNGLISGDSGYLWIWGAGGLARFDGGPFEPISVPSDSLDNGSVIRALVRENEHTLLMLPPGGGIERWKDGVFSPHPAAPLLAGADPSELYVEPGGAVWVGFTDSRVLRWEIGNAQWFGQSDGLQRRTVGFTFAADETGSVWIGSAYQLSVYSHGQMQTAISSPKGGVRVATGRAGRVWISTPEALLVHDRNGTRVVFSGPGWPATKWGIQHLMEDDGGRVWIGTRRHGVLVLDHGQLTAVPGPKAMVTGLMEDFQQNIWAASAGEGIFRIRPKAFVQLDRAAGLAADASTAVCEDSKGTIYLADREGGLAAYSQGRIRHFPAPNGDTRFYVNTVCCDQSDRVWVGAFNGIFRMPAFGSGPMERMPSDLADLHVLYCARDGSMWAGSGDGSLGYFTGDSFHAVSPSRGKATSHVNCLAEDAAGRMWIAQERELFEFTGHQLVRRLARNDFPGGYIHALDIDADQNFWIATDHGLILRRGLTMHRFTPGEGLPDDAISQVLEDGNGRLWLGGPRGYLHVAKADLIAVVENRQPRVHGVLFGKSDGLMGVSSMGRCQPAAWKSADGKLWFTTYEGVIGLDPAKAPLQPPSPRVLIAGAKADGADGARENAAFPPLTRQLEIRFGVPSFVAPERTELHHRLLGYDAGWVTTPIDRVARYTRLPPGNYTLQVAARDEDGPWSRPTLFQFRVQPTWWQTWWAQAAAATAVLAVVGAGLRRLSLRALRQRVKRLEREQALERERSRIARDLHDELGAGLTRIGLTAERIRRTGPGVESEQALAQLALDARRVAYDLAGIVWTVNPKNSSLGRLIVFIERFASGLLGEADIHCRIVAESEIPDLPIQPEWQHDLLAVAKEALNNLVKHSGASAAEVAMELTGPQFRIKIQDNGRGFDPGAAELRDGNGLSNMRRRIEEIGGEFTVQSRPGHGTAISFSLPINPIVRPPVPKAEPVPSS